MSFFRAVTGGTGKWGWVFAWAVTGGMGVNGLKGKGIHRASSPFICDVSFRKQRNTVSDDHQGVQIEVEVNNLTIPLFLTKLKRANSLKMRNSSMYCCYIYCFFLFF